MTILGDASNELAGVHEVLGTATSALRHFVEGAEKTATRHARMGVDGIAQRAAAIAREAEHTHEGIAVVDGQATQGRQMLDAISASTDRQQLIGGLNAAKDIIGGMNAAAAHATGEVNKIKQEWAAMMHDQAGPGVAVLDTVTGSLDDSTGRATQADTKLGEMLAVASGGDEDF